MPQNIVVGHKQLMAEAEAEVDSMSTADAIAVLGQPDVAIIDIRDPREIEREGRIPGSFHAPRGMLEFWVDPESPYHKPIFAEERKFIIHCASGWRSLLATQVLQDRAAIRGMLLTSAKSTFFAGADLKATMRLTPADAGATASAATRSNSRPPRASASGSARRRASALNSSGAPLSWS